jgi:hypothetical protein
MSRITATAILLATVPWLCACDDSTTTDATSDPLTFTVTPSPAVAVQSTDGKTYTIVGDSTHADKVIAYPWKTKFTVTMEETGGVGRDITSMNVKVQQASAGIVVVPSGSDVEHYDSMPQASGNRIEAKGRASVTFEVWYDLPNKGQEALITMTFTFTDDNDLSFSESTTVQVR